MTKSLITETRRGLCKIHKHQAVLVYLPRTKDPFRGVILAACAKISLVRYNEYGLMKERRLNNLYLFPVSSAEAARIQEREPKAAGSRPLGGGQAEGTPPANPGDQVGPSGSEPSGTAPQRRSLREILNVSPRSRTTGSDQDGSGPSSSAAHPS